MPRYFFRISEGNHHAETYEVDLADPIAARRDALKFIGELMIHSPMGEICSDGELVMAVTDETAQELFTIRLSTSSWNDTGSG